MHIVYLEYIGNSADRIKCLEIVYKVLISKAQQGLNRNLKSCIILFHCHYSRHLRNFYLQIYHVKFLYLVWKCSSVQIFLYVWSLFCHLSVFLKYFITNTTVLLSIKTLVPKNYSTHHLWPIRLKMAIKRLHTFHSFKMTNLLLWFSNKFYFRDNIF